MFRSNRITAGALAALAFAASTTALAAPPQAADAKPEFLRHLDAARQAFQHTGRPAALQARVVRGDIDTVPPVLTSFNVGKTVDVSSLLQPLDLAYAVTDDFSGFRGGYVQFEGPQGQFAWAWFGDAVDRRSERGRGVEATLTPFSMNGDWHVTTVQLMDAAYNYSFYSEQDLIDRGANTHFTVINTVGVDQIAPTLVSGITRTRAVSMSRNEPGTTGPSPAVVELRVRDTGDTVASGVQFAQATYCLDDNSSCFSAYGNTLPRGFVAGPVMLNAFPSQQVSVVGNYALHDVTLYDRANNVTHLVSTAFGGTTDFSQYFDSTIIKLTP